VTEFNGGTPVVGAVAFAVDNTPPIVSIASPSPGQLIDAANPAIALSVSGGTAQCRYDDEPYGECDAAFAAKILPDGPHTLWVYAIDPAGNAVTTSVTFTIDAFLGPPPAPQNATFARSSRKIKNGKFKSTLKLRVQPAEGSVLSKACSGKVTLSVKGKVSRKKTKTFTKQADLQIVGDRCAASATFTLPKSLKRKKLSTRAKFGGNAEMGAFNFTGTIKKA
jgi:hypothetical protein